MRLDLFLTRIRLARTRGGAQRLLDDTSVRIDGRRITKPATQVSVGQVVTLLVHGSVRVFEIRSLPQRRGPASEAKTHIRELED